MTGRRPVPWRESPVGGHGVRAACVVESEPADAAVLVTGILDGLARAGFAAQDAPAGVTVLRRGSRVADTLLTGSGLAALTKRLGPLSLHAIVVVERVSAGAGRERVTAAMVAGDALAPEIAATVDAAIDRAVADGADVEGPGWMRAVDLPADSLGNPRTAADAGIR
jgi:hypothetical protein